MRRPSNPWFVALGIIALSILFFGLAMVIGAPESASAIAPLALGSYLIQIGMFSSVVWISVGAILWRPKVPPALPVPPTQPTRLPPERPKDPSATPPQPQ